MSLLSALMNTPYSCILHTDMIEDCEYNPQRLVDAYPDRLLIQPTIFLQPPGLTVRAATLSDIYRIKILNENGFDEELIKTICQLMMANTDVWNLESEVRMGKEGELGYSEVGKRAIEIRECNKRRIEAVNKINEMFGEKRKESKFNHASG